MPKEIRRGRSYSARRLAWLNGICPYCEKKTEIEITEKENGGVEYHCLECNAVNPFTRGSKPKAKKKRN